MSGGYPDIKTEVERFLNGYDRLVRLPLISDAEVEALFSPVLLKTLANLRQYDQAEGICASCSDRCCTLIHCEIYDPALGVCPAFNLRPLLCRMHYCHKFEVYSGRGQGHRGYFPGIPAGCRTARQPKNQVV